MGEAFVLPRRGWGRGGGGGGGGVCSSWAMLACVGLANSRRGWRLCINNVAVYPVLQTAGCWHTHMLAKRHHVFVFDLLVGCGQSIHIHSHSALFRHIRKVLILLKSMCAVAVAARGCKQQIRVMSG